MITFKLKREPIKKYLDEKHIYQYELGNKIGVRDDLFSLYVNGKRYIPFKKAIQLSKEMGIEFEELVECVNEKKMDVCNTQSVSPKTEPQSVSSIFTEEKKVEETTVIGSEECKPVDHIIPPKTESKIVSTNSSEERELGETAEAESNELKPVEHNSFTDRLCNYLNTMPKEDKYARLFVFLFVWFFVMTQCPIFSRGLDEPLFWWVATVVSVVLVIANKRILKKEYKKTQKLADS